MHFWVCVLERRNAHLKRNSQEVDLNHKIESCQGASANPS